MSRCIQSIASIFTAVFASILVVVLVAGCDPAPPTQPGTVTTTPTAGDQPLGSISFALQLGASIQIDSVEYAVTGPGGFQRIGSLDVSRSTTVSGIIGDLPAGAGYTLALTATDVNQRLAVCRGSATFDVVPRTDTPVSIHMTCLEAPTQSVPLSPLAMLALAAALVMAGTAALGRRRADSKR